MRRRAAGVDDDRLTSRVGVPRLHRRSLVRCGEGREHRVAGVDLGKIALHDLGFVALGAAPEVAAHRIDRLPAELPYERLGAAPILLRKRWAGEVDALHVRPVAAARVIGPIVRTVDPTSRSTDFVALGHAGSDHYAGLETFPNPGVARVEMTSDELAAICPVTGQPDLYIATIEYAPEALCIESKSLKLYLAAFRNEGQFCEALTVRIRDDVAEALKLDSDSVAVTLEQKARGGITITASA